MPTRFPSRFQPDGFVLALIGTVAVATLLPCQGTSAVIFHALGSLAVASLFFLQGARLSRAALVAGAEHWRLHAAITSATFVLFPLLGWASGRRLRTRCRGRCGRAYCSSVFCPPPCSRRSP